MRSPTLGRTITTSLWVVIAYFYFPETIRKTLEQIAEDFGDKLVMVDEMDVDAEAVEEAKMAEKGALG